MKLILDLSYLENITGGNNEIMHEMLVLFAQETPKQIAIIKEYANQKEWEKVRAEAHKVKPTFQYLGLDTIYSDVIKLEAICKTDEEDEIHELIDSINAQFSEIKPQVDAKIKDLA